jgi:hypothetical protein
MNPTARLVAVVPGLSNALLIRLSMAGMPVYVGAAAVVEDAAGAELEAAPGTIDIDPGPTGVVPA